MLSFTRVPDLRPVDFEWIIRWWMDRERIQQEARETVKNQPRVFERPLLFSQVVMRDPDQQSMRKDFCEYNETVVNSCYAGKTRS